MNNPPLVIVTARHDLEGHLFNSLKCRRSILAGAGVGVNKGRLRPMTPLCTHPLPMVLPPTTRRAGRMNPAVRFTEASIHTLPRHDTREEDARNELVAEPRRARLKA